MRARHVRILVILGGLLVVGGTVLMSSVSRAAESASNVWKARGVARRIDDALGLTTKNCVAANDGEFLRRVYLDLDGRIPTTAETKRFLDDGSPGKRDALIDRLLSSREFADYTARRWEAVLLGDERRLRVNASGKILSSKATLAAVGRFRSWLADRIQDGTPWPRIVRSIVAAKGDLAEQPAVLYKASFFSTGTPALGMANAVSRDFLGVEISCARCHDHPFDRWTRKDYYHLAAFAARVKLVPEGPVKGRSVGDLTLGEKKSGDIAMPGTKEVMQPRFLTGGGRGAEDVDRMTVLAADLTESSSGASQVARNLVNRAFAYLLGRGFVNPVDGFNRKNRPIAREAFRDLVAAFGRNGSSLKFLLRSILYTRAYQSSSKGKESRPFSRQTVRQLSGEQLYRSLVIACEAPRGKPSFSTPAARALERGLMAQLDLIAGTGASVTSVTPLPGNARQTLLLRNGELVRKLILSPKGLIGRVYRLQSDPDRIEAVFRAVLCRRPTYEEIRRFTDYVRKVKVYESAYEDVVWTLVNSTEFLTRH